MNDETSKVTLGRLAEVDLRTIWTDEAGDFTPWLAKEDNLALLGDTIGIELDIEATEKNVGPFRADILCKDTANGNWVLIENQLERTDHTHLGQLLTYAAGLKAVTIVWIAARFTDEHRATLDWLNDITDDRFNFFGLEIETWRIGDSPVAPKFNVVCKPNEWARSVHKSSEEKTLTDTKILQRDYWAALREHLLDRHSIVKPQSPRPQHWANFALGRSHFRLLAAVNTQEKTIRVAVECDGPDRGTHFRLLQQDKQAIEQEVGCELEWDERPNLKHCHIEIRLPDADPTDRSDWPRQHQWMTEKLEALYRAFAPRVKKLDASEYEPEHEEVTE